MLACKQLWLPARSHPDKDLLLGVMHDSIDALAAGVREKGWAAGSVEGLLEIGRKAIEGEDSDFGLAVLNDTHWLLYQVQYIFWLQADAVVEYALMRYKPGGHPHELFAAIDQLTKQAGASQTVLSTSASMREASYSRLLHQHGFRLSSMQFVKRIE